ncbi:MAG TPA: DUF5615 family PIN-like protein [Anaerolineae bacterium]
MTALLFDQNLSPKLPKQLDDIFPNSVHVSQVGLDTAHDRTVWEYAHINNYILVSKDADFSDLSLILGFPPKVVWLRRGNCSTSMIERLPRENFAMIELLSQSEDDHVLVLF